MPLIIIICKISRKELHQMVLLILLFLLSITWGNWLIKEKVTVLEMYDKVDEGESVVIQGEISNIWESTGGISVEVNCDDTGVKAVCYFDSFDYEIGRKVAIYGEKMNIRKSSNPGEFDLKEYYNSKEIFLVLNDCHVTKVGKDYSEIFQGFYNVRQRLKAAIEKICDEEEAGVICAMLFGDKENLDGKIKDLYTMSGIGHILSISGLHISLAGGFVYQFMRKFTRQPAAFLVSSGIMLCFCGVSGASVSTVRAVIMYMINIFARVLGRKYDIKNSLAIAMIWVLIDNPLYINNGGFILSFLSVAGIAFVLPVVNEIFEEIIDTKKKKGVELIIAKATGSFVVSTALYFVTLMVVADSYYEIPSYSIVLNMLLVPLMGGIVISGFIGGATFYIAEPLGQIIVMVAVLILKMYKLLCEILMELPFNVWVTGGKSMCQIIIYYGLLVGVLVTCVVMKRQQCKKIRILGVMSVGIVVMLCLVLFRNDYSFNITVLDVGQGDCIYVESPDGKNYLIDGGSTDESNIGKYKLEPFLKHRGRDSLTAIFVTHTDMDHISGIIEVLENRKIVVENIVFGKYMPEKNETYAELHNLALEKGINVSFIGEGDIVGDSANGVEFVCLNPIAGFEYENVNAASIVLLGKYKEYKFLLTGDIGESEEMAILEQYEKDIEDLLLMKVAHHGSKYSSGAEFLDVASPVVSVISCGENNSYGHPHKEVLERLEGVDSYVYITRDYGAIYIDVIEGEIDVRSFLR